jgi:hypothetical protein
VPALDRGGRSAEEWVAYLRLIGDGGMPRINAPPRVVLWSAAEHSHAPPHIRIAAAVALTGASATDADRVRIAKLADDFASSPIRDATELTSEDEAVLAKALASTKSAKARRNS